MGCRSIANRLAEHAPPLGSVSSRPGFAAYGGAGLVDFVGPAGSAGAVIVIADTAQRNKPVPKVFSMSKSSIFTRHHSKGGVAVKLRHPRGERCVHSALQPWG